uniref:Uncharacterized protein n=1 Tax=Rhizophora mucronata TaxID=61149 RepID=A0A2P2IKZ5_RHIMU
MQVICNKFATSTKPCKLHFQYLVVSRKEISITGRTIFSPFNLENKGR